MNLLLELWEQFSNVGRKNTFINYCEPENENILEREDLRKNFSPIL
jgi:hypothetical protein